MPLEIYRRHNPARCNSTDSKECQNKKRPCPIWIRGTAADGGYLREPVGTRDWTKADDLRREWEVTGRAPTPAVEKRITIDNWKDQFLQNAEAENLSEETIRKYKLLFKRLMEFADEKGVRFVSELDLSNLEAFRNTWKDGPLSKSKKQERLRSLFRYAVAHKWINENPALLLKKIKVDPAEKLPFDDKEMEKILKAARKVGPETYAFVLTMRFSGLRISDVCTLNVSSLEGNHLELRTIKTGSKVKVLLPDVVVQSLNTIEKVSPKYFFWSGNGKLSSITELWRSRRLRPTFKAAGIKDAHPHRFRHTFATKLLIQGVPIGMVATLLGNSVRIVEKHYSSWTKARQKALDEAVTRANGYGDIEPVVVAS
jgi:site-specific recombinase XerD